jgi:hypothetical protein
LGRRPSRGQGIQTRNAASPRIPISLFSFVSNEWGPSWAAKNVDVGVLMRARLAPDMRDFTYQVQSACDYVKAGAAWLSGQTPPKHEDNEQTVDELRARIRKTESVKESRYAGASGRSVTHSWNPGKILRGEDYVLQMTIPNVYFHLAMAYAILRHSGVDIRKVDFLGPMNFLDADPPSP